MKCVTLIAMLFMLNASGADADTWSDAVGVTWSDCIQQDALDADRKIAGCSKAIEDTENINTDERATAYVFRGHAYSSKNELELAIADFNQAIELKPGFAVAYFLRGRAHFDRNELDRAIIDFDKYVEIDSGAFMKDAYYFRASAYGRKGQLDRAIADYSKVIEIDPKNANAYYNRAHAFREKGELDKAKQDFDMSWSLGTGFSK